MQKNKRHFNFIGFKSLLIAIFALVAIILPLVPPGSGPVSGQEMSAVQTEPVPTQGSQLFPPSNWLPEMIGPPPPTIAPGEIVTTVLPNLTANLPFLRVYSDATQQIPVIQVRGEYFDPSGLCSTGALSRSTNQTVRNDMKKAQSMGYKCFTLRVDWPSVEPDAGQLDVARLQELLQYADDLGLKVIISLELNRAPAWFFRGSNGPSREMASYLVDPEMETATGNDGPLRWADGTGVPNFYHPDTIVASKRIVYSLFNTIGKEPALLGWLVNGPVTMAFPGGGRNGIIGITDYSPYTVSTYNRNTSSIFMTYPLTRYSQGSWDSRLEYRDLMNFRLSQKREAFDELLDALIEVDDKHMILVGMNPVLNYRNDNGYASMVMVPDATRQLLYRGVNGAAISFRLSSKTFEANNSKSETSAMHLGLTINQVIRNNRIAIVLIEKDVVDPPSLTDISQIAEMIKAAGGYPVWTSGFNRTRTVDWSWQEENAIERTQPLSLLPAPKRLRRGQVAILDLPQFYASFYAEENQSVSLALIQLAIHQRTGVVLEMVSSDELGGGQPRLQNYNNIIYLVPELLTDPSAKSWLSPATQVALYGYSVGGSGIIEAAEPMMLHQYVMEDYSSVNLEDQLRTRYVHRGATADLLHGADAFIIANDPYVFMRVNDPRGAKYIDVKMAGWPISTMDRINMISTESGKSIQLDMVSNNASFPISHHMGKSQLFCLSDEYQEVAMPFENRSVAVTMAQQSRNMRRSVPAALLLAALLVVTLVWMTFQSQQRSLLQAAELIERRRRIEPIDILDQPEVMEFYKQYISSGTESADKDKYDGITRNFMK